MREYAARRGWSVVVQVREVGSGASERELCEQLLDAARRREIDVVLVWRLDRWGRSVADLIATLQELSHLGVGFVSLTEALDLTTPIGRAMAGLLAVFAEFEREILGERVRAGLAHARQNGKRLGRPPTAARKGSQVMIKWTKGIFGDRSKPSPTPHFTALSATRRRPLAAPGERLPQASNL
jgi:DNA invertase Pin-like site-specific DNA recombinase